MKNHTLAARIPLPANYRRANFLAYHDRDAQRTAETATATMLEKGIVWSGNPACLRIEFTVPDAVVTLAVNGPVDESGDASLHTMVTRMLGLNQDTEGFEAAHGNHPLLGAIIASRQGLRVAQTASAFEALCWAVIGQLVSVSAAIAMRRRFILAAGIRHSDGLWCFPDPEHVAVLNEDTLRNAGLSRTKAKCLLALSTAVLQGNLPVETWTERLRNGSISIEAITTMLTSIPGIGPWTVNYALLRGLDWMDGSLHGDVAVRRNLARLLGMDEQKISLREAEMWLSTFTPWRGLVAAHLWASGRNDGN